MHNDVFNLACRSFVILFASLLFATSPARSADPVDAPVGNYEKNWCAIPENGEWIRISGSPQLGMSHCTINRLRIWTNCGDSDGVSSVFNRDIKVMLTLNAAFCSGDAECGVLFGDFERREPHILRRETPGLTNFQSAYFPPSAEQQTSGLIAMFEYDDQGTHRWCGGMYERVK